MPAESLPTSTIGLIAFIVLIFGGLVGAAIKALSDKWRNGRMDSQAEKCAYHKGLEAAITNLLKTMSSKVDGELFRQRNSEFSQRLEKLERAIIGGEGLQVMVGRLDERMDIATKLADAMMTAFGKGE